MHSWNDGRSKVTPKDKAMRSRPSPAFRTRRTRGGIDKNCSKPLNVSRREEESGTSRNECPGSQIAHFRMQVGRSEPSGLAEVAGRKTPCPQKCQSVGNPANCLHLTQLEWVVWIVPGWSANRKESPTGAHCWLLCHIELSLRQVG